MGEHWKVAERYSSILQRVLDEYNEYQRSSSTADAERSTPSTVKILADMRRCAFDLDFLISRQPRSSPSENHTATSTTTSGPSRNVAPNELEYLDIFGFFNVPRVPPPSQTPDITNLGINESANDPMSIHGLTTGTSPTTHSVVDNSASNSNEFNITNYLIPTPETDWLFRPAG